MGENAVHPMIVVMVAEDAVEPEFAWQKKDREYVQYFNSPLWIVSNMKNTNLYNYIKRYIYLILTGTAWNNRPTRT